MPCWVAGDNECDDDCPRSGMLTKRGSQKGHLKNVRMRESRPWAMARNCGTRRHHGRTDINWMSPDSAACKIELLNFRWRLTVS